MTREEIQQIAKLTAEMVVAQLTGKTGPFDKGEPPGLLTKDELSHVMRKTPQCIDRWSREGMPYEDRGTYKLFDRAACEAWAKGRRRPGRPPVAARAETPTLRDVELRTRKPAK